MVLRWSRLAGRKIQLRFHNEARNFVVRLTQWHRVAETNYRNNPVGFFFQSVIGADRRFLHDSHLPNQLRLLARRLRSSSIDVDKSGRPGTVVTTCTGNELGRDRFHSHRFDWLLAGRVVMQKAWHSFGAAIVGQLPRKWRVIWHDLRIISVVFLLLLCNLPLPSSDISSMHRQSIRTVATEEFKCEFIHLCY